MLQIGSALEFLEGEPAIITPGGFVSVSNMVIYPLSSVNVGGTLLVTSPDGSGLLDGGQPESEWNSGYHRISDRRFDNLVRRAGFLSERSPRGWRLEWQQQFNIYCGRWN